MPNILLFLLKRPIAIFMSIGLTFLFGLISLKQINFALLPNIEYPRLTILTKFENSSANEVENLVTKYLTDSLNTISRVEQIESESLQGLSIVKIRFKYGTNLAISTLDVREKIDQIRDILPRDASRPLITRFNPGDAPFIQIAFAFKDQIDDRQLRSYLEENVIHYFERIDGISNVQISGGYKKEILIELDPERMNFYKTSLDELKYRIVSQNKNIPAGQLPFGNKELLIKTKSQFESLDDIRNLIVGSSQKLEHFHLADLATVNEVYKDRQSFVRSNGKDAIIINLYKESSKNSFTLSNEINQIIKENEELFAKNLNYEIIFNEADYIEESVFSLIFSLVVGAILAYLSLLIILKNSISPALLITTIPLSIIISILFFKFFGLALNLMSMGGLAIGIGMLFDSSNVVLSGIERNLKTGKPLETAVYDGVLEVIGSVSSATMTTVIVFLPLVFLESLVGILFSELAFSIIIIIIVSYIISITFLPACTIVFYKYRNNYVSKSYFFRLYDEEKMKENYVFVLKKFLKGEWNIRLSIAFILLISVGSIFFLNIDFLPEIKTGRFVLRCEFPKGTPVKIMNERSYFLENEVGRVLKKNNIFTYVSRDEYEILKNPNLQREKNLVQIEFMLDKSEVRIAEDLVNLLSSQTMFLSTRIWIEDKGDLLSQLVMFRRDVMSIEVTGDSEIDIFDVGLEIRKTLERNKLVKFVRLGMDASEPELLIRPDNLKIASFGLLNQNIADLIKMGLTGEEVTKYKVNASETDIRLKFKNDHFRNVTNILDLRLLTRNGENLGLGNIVEYKDSNAYPSIYKSGNNIVNNIQVKLVDGKNDTREQILSLINSSVGKKSVKIRQSDEIKQIEDAIVELLITLLLSAIIVYMILSGIFETFTISLIMLLSAPIVILGTLPFILISQTSLNVSSFIGMILLIGVLVDNASLFFEYFILHLKNEKQIQSAIVLACQEIFRPVLMNNSTTILGMLPIAFGLGLGTEFQFPLSIVVIAGLIISSFASLFIVPYLFYIYFRNQAK
ncbi:efflux RND transporter permease subunit [Leptospira sp. 96542]|nr:efflux RND transporter permease subunit [Leptospira sp. 96542]